MKALANAALGLGFGALVGLLAACSGSTGGPPVGEVVRLDGPLEPEAPPSGTGNGQAEAETDQKLPGGESSSPQDKSGRKPADPGDADPGEPGGNRLASGEHCCFNGTYLRCPNAVACFGGFDVNDCLSKCADLGCIQACTDKLGTAGAPKGCDADAVPPASVDCAHGQIGL